MIVINLCNDDHDKGFYVEMELNKKTELPEEVRPLKQSIKELEEFLENLENVNE